MLLMIPEPKEGERPEKAWGTDAHAYSLDDPACRMVTIPATCTMVPIIDLPVVVSDDVVIEDSQALRREVPGICFVGQVTIHGNRAREAADDSRR